MTNRGYEGKRCPPSKTAAGGKKLLGNSENCASLDVRSALDETAAQRGSSELRGKSKAPAASGSHWADTKLRNMSVAQKYGNKKLPNALIVGVKKGGTRAVLEFIRIHPDVRALGTEPHFFDRNYDRGLDWYSAVTSTRTLVNPPTHLGSWHVSCQPGVMGLNRQLHEADAGSVRTIAATQLR
ncbi:unnamed protein product [Pleuronectes platessa]|uniref:Sulfotransferase n=1 Tax=Pleuronectes platessa TaxID=8262 RepID=A0A9N7U885_PLEPL|nr:unnamed protein product [Pleuronectes platessa]